MKFKNIILVSVLTLFASSASATIINCYDTTSPAIASSGATASSSITTNGATVGATVSNANCGPHVGNTSSDLTKTAGGYGFNLFDSTTDPDGWVFLDKFEQNKLTSNWESANGIISGTGWGTTLGTFSFADAGYDDYLIGLKFDGVYSTFLSNSWADAWGWNTDVDGDGKFEISNLTVYVRNPSTVPEPGMLALLAIGLVGMVATRRRMKL